MGGFAGQVEKNESEEQREWDGERSYNGSANTDQKENQNDQDENHAVKQILFHSTGGDTDQIAAVVIRTNPHVARQHGLVDFLGPAFDRFQDVLGLLSAAHQNDAFYGIV